MRKKLFGFTLIEVLVAATIVAILSTIGLTSYQSISRGGRDALRKANLETVRSALEMYRAEYNTYPGLKTTCQPLLPTNFLDSFPFDPQPSNYRYCYLWVTTSPLNYQLCAHLENNISPTINCGFSQACLGSCNYQVVNP